jgi:ribosomal protein S7
MKTKSKSFNNLFYSKFLGVLLKKGKKTKAKKILDTVLLKVSKSTKLSIHLVLYRVFFNLNTFVEVRRVRVKRRSFLVPFNVSFSRRISLMLKWILLTVRNDSRRTSTINKLSIEIFTVVKNFPCNAMKFKKLNDSRACSKRANIHFRW